MIYACDACKFLFEKTLEAGRCPDCGKFSIRKASEAEIEEYKSRFQNDDNSLSDDKNFS